MITHPASTSAANWETEDPTKYYFHQKGGSASDSMNQLVSATTYGECKGAITACAWWGALQGMKPSTFNALYVGTRALDMEQSRGSSLRNTKVAADQPTIVPGDWVYFNNFNYNQITGLEGKVAGFFHESKFLDEHGLYSWSGENALYLGNDLYGGLGLSGLKIDKMKSSIANL